MRWVRRGLLLIVVVVLGGLAVMVRLDRNAAEVEARWATPPSKLVEVDGMRVHVRERGAGPALVLLHGSNASLFTWEGWARELEGERRVIAMDLPGHGLTGPDPKERYLPADMAEFVARVATALGVERFALAGNSMGGAVALELALAHPERVEKLILVDAAGIPREEPRPLVYRLAGAPVVGNVLQWVTPRFIVASTIRQVYGDPSKVTEENIDRYYDLLLREGNRRATRLRMSRPPPSVDVSRLGGLRMPVLILWGARDRWILPKYGERLRDAIPGSRLVMLDGLGHVPMEEDPAGTARIVKEFLGR